MPISRDLKGRATVTLSLSPATISTNTTTAGSGVAVDGSSAVMLVFQTGTRTDGTYTPDVQFSDDNSTWSDAASYELNGAETAITASNTIVTVGVKPNVLKKYVRGRFVSTGTSSGCTACSISVIELAS